MTTQGHLPQTLAEVIPPTLVGSQRTDQANRWWPVRTSAQFAIGGVSLAAILSGFALLLALSTTHLEHPGANALVRPYLIASPILIGVFWKLRRPDSRFGLLLIVLGLAFFPVSWHASNDPLVHMLGIVLGDTLGLLATFYVALSFPVGRLSGRADRATMVVLAAGMVALALSALGRPLAQGGGPLSRCGDACPPNPIQISLPPPVLDVIAVTESIGLLTATAATIVIIGVRIARASRPRRHAFVGAATTSLIFFSIFLTYQLIRRTMGAEAPILEPLGWINIAARLIFALGFLWVLLQAELSAGSTLRTLLGRLKDRPTPQEWKLAVTEALDDQSLQIGFWDPARSRYRLLDGKDLQEPTDPDRTWVTVQRDQDPVAAFTVDGALRSDPELLRSVGDATLLAVEYGALEGELRTSRRAEVQAADLARRRIAQDLHDSAQQRLIALRMHLDIVRERMAQGDGQEALDAIGVQVDDALGDIRAVSRGTHTDRLRRHGLAIALETVASSMGTPVSIQANHLRRYPDDVEEAVYLSVLEALQNVAKHAGPGANATITLTERDGVLTFAVTDDGIGFDPRGVEGLGLASMTARVAAVGGRLRLESASGAGTSVSGAIPIDQATESR
jgi:signal transduction histidine kinase